MPQIKPTDSGRDSRARIPSHFANIGRTFHSRDSRARIPSLFETPSVTIGYDGGELVVIDDNDENAIWLPISPQGMRLLAYRLLAKAVELEVEAAQ